MFGFLAAPGCDSEYRRVYAACCQNLWQRHGRLSTIFHSYESVFLYCLATDLGVMEGPEADAPKCCRLWHRQAQPPADTKIAAFCAATALLLASIKLQDDVDDDRSLVARTVRWGLRNKLRTMREFFRSCDPHFDVNLARILDSHAELERSRSRSAESTSLAEFSEATGQGFRYLFEMFACHAVPERQLKISLGKLGQNIGLAIVAFDCAVDWTRDRQQGSFNPLQSRSAVDEALVESQRRLAEAGWSCVELVGDRSLSARILRSAFHRVSSRRKQQSLASPPRRTSRLAFPLAARRGDCDCCCPCQACGDCGGGCGDCGGAGCDGCGGGPGCEDCAQPGDCQCHGPVCCDPCCLDCWPYQSRTARASSAAGAATQTPDTSPMMGRVGQTVGPLKPSGIVRIDGQDFPAQAALDYIEAGESVKVIGENAYGLIVLVSTDDSPAEQSPDGAQ